MPELQNTDAELVTKSLAGNRTAFGHIVERYQTLICSLAYSATGSLTQSEDLSQETFVAAWKQLPELREPGKLRSWLCGIVRNLTRRTLRGQVHEPAHAAEPLDSAQETPALDAHPLAQAISREEEAILWRSLERIPEIYREPLILFYREHESVERVAQVLELSEDAVRQRLSRGRKLLHEEIATFVEGALRQTAPGQAFSGAVLAALPLATGSAAMASMGAGAKGTAAAKSGFLATLITTLTPFLGIVAGVFAQCLIIQNSTSDRKLRVKLMLQVVVYWIVVIGAAWGGEAAVRGLANHFSWSDRERFVSLSLFWWGYCCLLLVLMRIMAKRNVSFGRIAQKATANESSTPMPSGKLAIVILGAHVALFFALIRMACVWNDTLGACIISAAMLALSVAAFFRIRDKVGVDAVRAIRTNLGLCFGVILVALNLRVDVWVAAAYGVPVAEAHQLQPTWLVPTLSLALAVWAGLLSMATEPKAGNTPTAISK
jgi:RNA polymerase sigma factor (sigma-70 family)